MKLRARVRRPTGNTEHYQSALEGESLVRVAKMPDPVTVEIEEGENGYYLFCLDADGACVADTWHLTVGDAKAQAKFEFEIDEQAWLQVVD